MPCFHPRPSGPLVSYTDRQRLSGLGQTTFPCGQCYGCRLERSRQWAVRCLHEAQVHDLSSYVTLTYSDENLPLGGSLHYPDFQKFMKRLRQQRVRRGLPPCSFYMAGEYGEEFSRPHYHALLFGVWFHDRQYFKKSPAGFPLYLSEELSELWELGNVLVGDVSFESAAYVARYVMKKVTGSRADAHYAGRVPEFNRMSLNPAIGKRWFDRYRSEVYGAVGHRDEVVVNGVTVKPPRGYDQWLKELDLEKFEEVKSLRLAQAFGRTDHGREGRLRAEELVTLARMRNSKRGDPA